MAMKPFNSVPGFSVGKGTTTVILANGDVAARNLTVANTANLGIISNVIITGGSSGQIISTDGLGNLTFVNPATSQLSNGNSNVQVLNNGNITFSSAGNANVAVITGAGANINGYVNVTTTLTSGNVYANSGIIGALTLKGEGGNISNIQGANVSGTVARATNASALLQNTSTATTVYPTFTTSSANGNSSAVINTGISANLGNASITATTFVGALSGAATSATTAGTVTTNAQPNITSVGTLTSLDVTANVTAGNVYANSGTIGALTLKGEGGNISNIQGANVSGQVANSAIAGTVYTNAQPNITSVGTLGSLSVTGNANVGNLGTAQVLATANITTPQVIANVAQGTAPFVINSNTKVANLNAELLDGYDTATANTANTVAVRDASGNLSANFFIGNGSQLSGIITSVSNVSNGTSNLNIATSGGNVTVSVGGVANVLAVTTTGANITGTANITGNITTAGNIGIGTGTPDAELNILAVGQTVSYPVTGNSTTVGTDLHISGLNGSQTRITQDAFGTGSYVAFTGRAARGTGATPTQTQSGDTLSQFTGRGFSSGTLQFGNASTGRVDVVAAENFTDTSRATNVVIYTTSTGNIEPAAVATFTGTGANITGTANISGNVTAGNVAGGNLVSANYFSGNGSLLTGIASTFNALTDAITANVTIDEIVYQGTTRLIVTNSGTSGYLFSQYTGLNPTIYTFSGTTIALDLTAVGHPLLIQYGNGTNCDIGLTHVDTNGTLSAGALAQAKTTGTLYWQIPIDLVGAFKYQCFNHPAMNGAIILQNGSFAAGIAAYTGNLAAGNVNVTGRVIASNVTANNTVTSNVLSLNNSGPQFGTNPGDMAWNNTSETYELLMNDGVQQSIGQEQYTLVKANTAITLGQVIAYAGVNAGRLLGDPANAQASGFISSYVLGVAAQNIGVGNTGYITSFGQVDNINTNSFNIGDILYLDPAVPGGFTNVLPSAPNAKVQMASVLTKALTTGSLQVKVTGFPQLEQLRDVSSTPATNNQYLRYTTSGNYWIASNLAISNDPTPTLGANLNAATYSFANVNDISANTGNFNGAVYSNAAISGPTQLATKAYVDNASSAGIVVHSPVLVGTPTALTTTYTQGGTTPTITTIATGNVLTTSTTHGLSVNDIIVFGSTTNGLTAGTPYFVYSTPATNQITLTTSYNGVQITTLTNGTGLSITSRANSGVGAKLTNAGAQAALVLGGVTMALTNRVIVFGQTNAFENGVYTVTNIGSPSTNWELTRATDQDKYIPASTTGMSAGSYFYIQSGTRAGEAYVLSTTGAIVIGTTNLSYTLFSASLQYTGTSPVSVVGQTISLANLTGTGDFVVLANSPTLNTPNIGAATGTSLNVSTGNVNAGNLILTGLASITGNVGAGNINVQSGNVNANVYLGNSISVGGNISGGNFNPSGNLVVSGNATAANISTAGTLSVTGNANVGNIGAVNGIFTGNVTAGNANVTGQLISTVATGTAPFVVTSTTQVANLNAATANTTSFVNVAPVSSNVSYPTFVYANIAGDYPLQSNTAFSANLANGAFIATNFVGNLIGAFANGNSNVSIPAANGNVNISAVGNANIVVVTGTGANITGTANISGNANVGNLGTARVLATANVTAPQLISNVTTGTAPFVVTSTTQVANLNAATAGAATNAATVQTNASTSTTVYPTFVTASTNANYALNTVSGISANLANNAITATTFVGTLSGAATSATTAGTVTTNAQPNITSVGTLTGLTVGNATANAVFGNGTITLNNGLITGNGNGLSSLQAANVTGTLPNAVTNAISNVGTITAGTWNSTFTAGLNANTLANIQGANVSGAVASATAATNASALLQNTSTATTVYPTFTTSSANGNSSAVINTGISANLGNASITATTFVGALSGAATSATTAGTVTTNAQPNITSVGSLSALTVTGNANVGNLGTTQILASANITAPQFISNVITGTAPFVVTSTTVVANLNVDMLDGYSPDTANTASTIALRDTNGNLSANFFVGNGSQLTGIVAAAGAAITNGTSNVTVDASGNVRTSVAGNANVFVVTGTGANVAGTLQVSGVSNLGPVGNVVITGGSSGQYLQTDGAGVLSWQTVSGGGGGASISNGTSNVNIATSGGNVTTSVAGNANILVVTGTGANVTGTLDVTGNTTVGNLIGIFANGNSTIAIPAANGNINLNAGGSATPELIVTIAGANVTGTLSATANVTAPQLISNVTTGTAPFVVTSTTQVANLNVATAGSAGNIANGTSNVSIPAVNGNVNIVAAGNTTMAVTGTGANITGTLRTGGLNLSNAAWTTGGIALVQSAATYTDTTSPAGTVADIRINQFDAPTLAASNAITVSSLTGTYLTSPIAGANVTATSRVALTAEGLLVSGGFVFRAGGQVDFNTTASSVTIGTGQTTGALTLGGTLTTSTMTVGQSTATQITNIQAGATGSGNTKTINLGTGGVSGSTTTIAIGSANGTSITVNGNTTFTGNILGSLANGNSRVNIPAANGNVNLTAVGNTTLVITGTGANVNGTLQVSGVSNLGPVGNVVITGGSSGQYLQTNGAGGLSWQTVSGGGGGASISNGTSNVNIAASGGNVTTSVAGNANVFVVTGTGANVAGTFQVSGISNLGPNSNVTITGGASGQVLGTDGAGNLSWVSPSAPPAQSVVTVTSNTTMTTSTGVYFANGNLTLTLPAASGNAGVTFYVKNLNNQYVTVQGINTVDGASNIVLRYLNSAITLISSGTNWNIF